MQNLIIVCLLLLVCCQTTEVKFQVWAYSNSCSGSPDAEETYDSDKCIQADSSSLQFSIDSDKCKLSIYNDAQCSSVLASQTIDKGSCYSAYPITNGSLKLDWGLSTGAIIGIIAGCVAGCCIIGGIIYYCKKKKSKNSMNQQFVSMQ